MKNDMMNLLQQFTKHPLMLPFFALLSTLLKFIVESWQVDGLLFMLLFFLIAIDTITGVRLAKKSGTYNYKVLKDKTYKKCLGYLIFLIALWTFTIMLFLMNVRHGKALIDNYYLNVPFMTAILFFAGIEFLSIKDNIIKLYLIKVPGAIIKKVQDFVDAGGAGLEKLSDN